jgi:hypothetical protein
MLSLLKTRPFHNQNPPQPAARHGVIDTPVASRYTGGVIRPVVDDPGTIGIPAKVRATGHVIIEEE